ncbi:hypothetical protein BS78_08G085500 [Paspalum vaginatum]|nr:hypothetical protein BS78_08G085500 [Paspalum vaginatum]
MAAVLREDEWGIPRSLPLFAALVEAEARGHAAAASRPAGSDLIRAFRGRAAPAVSIREFLERVHRVVRSRDTSRHSIDGTCFVLAGIYLTRFIRSVAAREAGIEVDPATAHRLAAVALFLGTKFGGDAPRKWTALFELASDRAIRASEMVGLEERFLRAVSFRLFVCGEEFQWFCRVLEEGHKWQADAAVADGDLRRVLECEPVAPCGGSCTRCKKRHAGAAAREEDDCRRVLEEPVAPHGSCAGSKKRQADTVAGDEDDRRRVRACLLPPAVVSN